MVLRGAIKKTLCRKLNAWQRIKIADLLLSIRREAELGSLGYEAALPDPQTILFSDDILKYLYLFIAY